MTESGLKFTLSKGDKVWVPDDEECYKVSTIKEVEDEKKQVIVFDDQYRTQTLLKHQIFPVNPPHMNGVADNTELMHLHDPSLLHNIKYRYLKDDIYTYTAYILIAVNPYKSLPLYGEEMVKKYYGQSIGKLPPHVYAIADRAYRSMRGSKKSQSIVVSGESGAGKTETCKHVMRFMAAVSGTGPVGTVDELENKVLEANPILEAFGNAKTLRNNNSSRFGKFTELHFDGAAKMVGASIETYLLEKSRLVSQGKGERNFHVFYQLLKGASEAQKQKLNLENLDSYSFLSSSGCFEIEHVNDSKEFAQIVKSMTVIGISELEQESIFSVLSGLLHLGNVKFQAVQDGTNDSSSIEQSTLPSQQKAAQLFGLDIDVLKDKMLNRVMVAGGTNETYTIPLTANEASFTRDSLAKHIYQSLFDWIVSKINIAIPKGDSARFIGILDISGFEIFEENSFEQLCINFANEKIQQYFNQQILKQEQEIYELEGLRWRKVEYMDNQGIIDLFEGKRTGILALLDEECVYPKATDKTFALKVHTTHTTNEFLTKPTYAKKKKRLNENEAFVVKHFAGEVIYETKNFLTKNNGTLHSDLEQLLKTSKMKFFSSLFVSPDDDGEEVKYGQSGGRFKSIGGKFQSQLSNLMQVLSKTTSHFIRCIKPNTKQKPDLFVAPEVMVQLRYSGMCTALVLMQAGFPTRISFEDLFERYSANMPPVLAKLKPITFCEALLVALDLNGGKDFQMGLTKVFFRSGKLQFLDELMSDNREAIQAVVGKVKKWLARKRFHAAIWAVVSINRFGKLIQKVRLVRRFRRAVRYHVRAIRVWIGCLNGVRRRIYDEVVLARKREEEERRREAERLAEQKRREEEERRKREEEEERQRIEEEARRKAEEARRREEEARRAMENKIRELQDSNSKLVDDVTTVTQAREQAINQISQLNSKIELLLAEIRALEAKNRELDAKLKLEEEEKIRTQKTLEGILAQLSAETETRQGLEGSLKLEKEALASLQHKLEEERATFRRELDSLRVATESDKDKVVAELQKTLAEKSDLESKLNDEHELRKNTEAKNASLEENLKNEKHSFAQYKEESTKKANAAAEEFKKYREESESKIADLEAQLRNETNAKIDLQNKISDMEVAHRTASEQFSKHKQSLEGQLQSERETSSSLRDEIAKLQEEISFARATNDTLTSQKRNLEDLLSKERDTSSSLTKELALERQGRKDDNEASKKAQEEAEKKFKNDLSLKQAVIESLSIDKKKTEERLSVIYDSSTKKIHDLESKLAISEDKGHSLDEQVSSLGKNLDERNSRIEHLEREKVNLIEIAVKCQEAQLKLRNVYEKFPKDQDLVKLLFGDSSFNAIMRGNYIYAVLEKQGGANQKKWAERHFILNDTFLFYFAAKGDKEPKGIIRMETAKSVEKVDLETIGKKFAFKIALRNGRDYFINAPNAEELEKWVGLLSKLVP